MFYSQCLVSRQGPLRSIWVAAYYHKKLKKEQVRETDITSSVDEIILHEVTVTYRVLGYLLLGVVRIYSKKVEYLYEECTEVLTKINTYAISTKRKPTNEAMCASYMSITLPERFELDAFDLEIVEDTTNKGSPKACRQITLEDTWENAMNKHYFLDQCHQEEENAQFETTSTCYTPVKDVLSPHLMDVDLVGSPSHNLISKETSMERYLCDELPTSAGQQLALLCEDEEPLGFSNMHDQTSIKEFEDVGTQYKSSSQLSERISFLEITPLDLEKCQTPLSEGILASTADKTTDDLKFPSDLGAVTPDFLAIRTPAKKEQLRRVSRKRKRLFDDIIVLSNDVVRQSLHDSSNLVFKRRKMPKTTLDVWKDSRISHLREDFLEPIITCTSSRLKALFYGGKIQVPDIAEVPTKSGDNRIETQNELLAQNGIAGELIVDHSVPIKCSEGFTVLDTLENSNSLASEVELLPPNAQTTELNLIDEEMGPSEENDGSPDEWSVRTRSVARYLRNCFFLNSNQRENKTFNLATILEGRTRKESARLFYEILVLKSQEFVDVEQHEPYSDILVLHTPQLEAIV